MEIIGSGTAVQEALVRRQQALRKTLEAPKRQTAVEQQLRKIQPQGARETREVANQQQVVRDPQKMAYFQPGLAVQESLSRQQQALQKPLEVSKRQTPGDFQLREFQAPEPRPTQEAPNYHRVARELKKQLDIKRYGALLEDINANQRANRVIDDRTKEFREAEFAHTNEVLGQEKREDARRATLVARDKRAIDEYERNQSLRIGDQLSTAELFLVEREQALREDERRRLDEAFLNAVPRGAVIDIEA